MNNIEYRIKELEEYVKQVDSSFKLSNSLIGIINKPEEMQKLLGELSKGADAMAEIKGKVDRMEKEMDSNNRWQTALIVGIYTLCATVVGSVIALFVKLW